MKPFRLVVSLHSYRFSPRPYLSARVQPQQQEVLMVVLVLVVVVVAVMMMVVVVVVVVEEEEEFLQAQTQTLKEAVAIYP